MGMGQAPNQPGASIVMKRPRDAAPSAPVPDRYPHIVRVPEVHGGDPTVAGTRIPVWVIAASARMGQDVPDILRGYPALSHELVQEALAWAEEHGPEIAASFVEHAVELV